MRYLLVVFLLITNFSFYSATTIDQSVLGEFNLILSSQDEVLRKLCINTIKSHTVDLFSKYGSVDTVSFFVYQFHQLVLDRILCDGDMRLIFFQYFWLF